MLMNEELLNNVRALRHGQGVSVVRDYIQALYEETKEKIVDSTEDQMIALKAEARLLRHLYKEFGMEPKEESKQSDGAYT